MAPPYKPPFQFSLASLFALMAATAIVAAIYSYVRDVSALLSVLTILLGWGFMFLQTIRDWQTRQQNR